GALLVPGVNEPNFVTGTLESIVKIIHVGARDAEYGIYPMADADAIVAALRAEGCLKSPTVA
ncbi:hypothetical protein ACC791_36995, partial [Rhizobium ruizarguesonis]